MLDSKTMRSPEPLFRAFAHTLIALLALGSTVALTGCENLPQVDEEAERAAVEETIRNYLPALGEAYATGNVVPMKPYVVDKEIARVRWQIEEIGNQGKTYEPKFKDLTVENITIWQYANAYATTVEVWDIRSYATGSDTLLSEVLDQRNRVKYQLKKKEDGWKILYRELEEPLD